ncbi:MAG TPA: tetratricopeptide repeat protein [Candidatus Polarisedimenticolaceae bacterium]
MPKDPAAAPVGTATGRFVGSAACLDCHAEEHRRWAVSPHAAALRPVGGDVVPKLAGAALGEGASVASDGTVIGPGANGGPLLGRAAYVAGGRRREDLWVRLDDGRLQVFPWSWDVARKEPFQPYREGTGRPAPADSLDHWSRFGRNADLICYGCHATGHRIANGSSSVEAAIPRSTWVEAGVGCEACHGPAGPHVDAARGGGGKPVPPPHDPRRSCDGCHALREVLASPFGAEPAHRYGAPLATFGDPLPRVPADFEHRQATFADFRPATFGQQAAAFEQSGCARKGGLTCAACHDSHGGGLTPVASDARLGDAVCAPCHGAIVAKTSDHTLHAEGSPGSRCFACHLAPIVTGPARERSRDHSLAPPTAPAGTVPAACAACHAGGTGASTIAAAWNARALRSAAARRRTAIAEATAAAERGDPEAIAAMARIAGDPGESVSIRAIAAGAIGALLDRGASPSGIEPAGTLLDASDAILLRWGARLVGRVRPGSAPLRASDPWLALEAAASASALGDAAATVRLEELTRRPELANEWRAHVALGRVALQARDWPRAETAYRRALASNPFFLPAWNGFGIAMRGLGRESEARAAFERALALNPQYEPAKRNLEGSEPISGVRPSR